MRIAISKDSDNDFDDHVLLTHVPHPDNAQGTPYELRLVVDIPDIDCEKVCVKSGLVHCFLTLLAG